jgi:hypothetical protein
VWPRWSSGRVVVVARHAVAVGGGRDEVIDAAQRAADADAALSALAALRVPPSPRYATRRAEVWIDDGWTRMFGATWPESIHDVRLFREYVAARFEQRFELPASDWTIVSPGAWPGRPVLCVAVQTEFVARCRAALARTGLLPSRMLPLSLVEVGTSFAARPRTRTLFIGSAAPQRIAFLMLAGRLADCAVVPDCEHVEALATALFRERGLLDGGLRRTLRVDHDRAAATSLLLRRVPLKVVAIEHDPPRDRVRPMRASVPEAR